MKVTYIYHSGYAVEMEHAVFLFDYYKGTLPEFPPDKRLFVLASHKHQDHFRTSVFQIKKQGIPAVYILSDDIPKNVLDVPEASGIQKEQVLFMGPREELDVCGCLIQTLKSTDEGVAFLLRYEGKSIYHSGDLNWWHWEEEGTIYNDMMKRKYQDEIGKLQGACIDVAFLPLDPRLRDAYYWGLDYFMKHTDTKQAFPMHCWNQYDIVWKLKKEPEADTYRERIMEFPGWEEGC